MAQLQITIDLDNDAFEYLPDNARDEVFRILTGIAARLEEARESGKWENVRNINGNSVGRFKVDLEAEPSFN